MTVEKAVVAKWTRTAGCSNDFERRDFAQALARKRTRFAFPDDFNRLVGKLQSRMQDKHDKASPEGEVLQDLQQIRVRVAPSWNSSEIDLTFFLILAGPKAPGLKHTQVLDSWLKLIPPSGRFKNIGAFFARLEDLRASDYVESDLLDLDHLSGGR
jgi:hypothetical protein